MIFSPRINAALSLAARLHRNQVRNDSDKTPYIAHLIAVMLILSEHTDDEDILIAGLMHDSLEDVPNYTYEHLVGDCGKRVADIVRSVTEPLDASKNADEQLPWLTRKEAYLHVLQLGGTESAMVSAADKIHNTISFLDDIQKEGESFASRFTSSAKNRLWFHEQVLITIEQKLGVDNKLVLTLRECTLAFQLLVSK